MRCKHEDCGATDVWQVAYSPSDEPFARPVGLQGGSTPRPREWRRIEGAGVPAKLAEVGEGFFCAGCYRPRPDVRTFCRGIADQRPLAARGGSPVAPVTFDLDAAIAVVRKAAPERVGESITVSSPRAAVFARSSSLRELAPEVGALLRPQLYEHQRQAIQAGLDGRSVVISTDTASGKSLCYQALAAHLLATGSGTVLYLSPINALLVDQLDAMEQFFTAKTPPVRHEQDTGAYLRHVPLGRRSASFARYDGGVPRQPPELRREIKHARPGVVMTTPEMVVRALLPFASANKGPEIQPNKAQGDWRYFFQALRLVIVDELHAYRGVFGAHLANTLRRVRRMVDLSGGKSGALQFFACSATILHPMETARAITGAKDFELIGRDQDKSPRHRRVLLPISSGGERLVPFASRLLSAIAVEAGARTIAFRDHIPQIQGLAKLLGATPALRGRVEAYCSPANASDRLDRLRGLRDGRIQCLVSTSALELGIDVGSLNASVLLGYPGTISRTWQMLGRAGRSGDGLLVYVAGTGYLDEYWKNHADELVGDKAQPEDVVVDPDNVEIVEEHLRGAALDHVLDPKRDEHYFGPAFKEALKALKEDVVEGVRLEDDVWILRESGERRAREISLRGLGQFKVPVHLDRYDEDKKPLYEEEVSRVPRRLFPGATFVWDGCYYASEKLSIPEIDPRKKERPKAYVVVRELQSVEFLTTAKVSDETQILDQRGDPAEKGTSWGRVQVTTRVEGYFKSAEAVNEIEGAGASKGKSRYVPFTEENEPPRRAYRTHGAWFQLPPAVIEAVEDEVRGSGLNTLGEAFVRAAPLLRFASPGDLTASVRENVPNFDPEPVLFVNETVVGGAGLARQVFLRRKALVEHAHKLLADCEHCKKAASNGCPRCVALLDGSQDRKGAMAMLKAWAACLADPKRPKAAGTRRPGDPAWVLRELGLTGGSHEAGGMGQVLRARRDKEDVAIKIIRATSKGQGAEGQAAALREEARHLKKLDHPNILRLRKAHDLGGVIALELDWVEGGTLDDYLEGKPPSDELEAVWRKLVGAVAYMHGKGVVHRDLKPDNILMRGEEPILADFGIARPIGRETVVAGTELWEAPEQGKVGSKIAPTMDVYALGRLLSYVFTGSLNPFAGKKTGSLAKVPAALHDALRKCLAESPRDRYPDAGALLKAISRPAVSRRR